MKKPLLSLFLALSVGAASFLGVSAPARAAESSAQRAGRAALAATYKKQGQALIKKDMGALLSYVAPDFVGYTSSGQTYNRAQIALITQQALSGNATGVAQTYTKYAARFISLTWRGKDAIVMVEETLIGKAQRGAQSVRLEQVSLSRDYWTPTGAGWKVRQSAERESKVWLDGQRVQ